MTLSDIIVDRLPNPLKMYGNFVLETHPFQLQNKENIIIFANINNTGIGNLVWLYPVMRALERKGLVVVCEHEEMRKILSFNLPLATICGFDNIPKTWYGVSITNFLTLTNENVKKIISLRVPCRIGHTGMGDKNAWVLNYPSLTHMNLQEGQSNALLLKQFEIQPAPLQLDLPPHSHYTRENKFDVLFQVNTSNEPIRNYPYYEEVINGLNCKIGLIGSAKEIESCGKLANRTKAINLCGLPLIETAHLMKRAVVVGNDGGLVKLAYALGTPVIQLVKHNSEYLNRSWIDGSTLIDPHPSLVINNIIEKL